MCSLENKLPHGPTATFGSLFSRSLDGAMDGGSRSLVVIIQVKVAASLYVGARSLTYVGAAMVGAGRSGTTRNLDVRSGIPMKNGDLT